MLLSKLLEALNLGWTSDAVGVSRINEETSTPVAHNENVELPEEQEEEIVTESLSDDEIEEKPHKKKDSNSEKQDDHEEFSMPSQEERGIETTINVQGR